MHLARELWTLYEPIHVVSYFAPEPQAAYEAAGLRGYWRGYFAGRAAALGPVGPAPVIGAFFNFAPAMVARALPDVWSRATPDEALAARQAGTLAALRRILGDADVGPAADVLAAAVGRLDLGGRVLGAAYAAVPVPDEPLLRLWHYAGVLREHRGDGHVAAYVAHDVDGCESLALRASLDLRREWLQPYRGWTDEEWDAATERLRSRGLLGSAELLASVEAATDAAAVRPWLGSDVDRAREVLRPLARTCAGLIPHESPLGFPAEASGGA